MSFGPKKLPDNRVFSSPSQLPFRVASPVIELIYYPINFPYYFVRTLENDYLFGYKGGKREGIAKQCHLFSTRPVFYTGALGNPSHGLATLCIRKLNSCELPRF